MKLEGLIKWDRWTLYEVDCWDLLPNDERIMRFARLGQMNGYD